MAVEMLKDVRRVQQRPDGKYNFFHENHQVYDKENVDNMIAAWRKKRLDTMRWLSEYDKHVEVAKAKVEEELNSMRMKLMEDLASIDEGIKLWTNADGTDPEGSAAVPADAKDPR